MQTPRKVRMKREPVDLSVRLGKITLKNPVMPSSGTFGYGKEFADFLKLEELGAIIVKGTTLRPRLGNFEHRFAEIAGCGSILTIGLQNVGVHRFIEEKLPYLRQFATPVIVNVAGESVEEFVQVTEVLNKAEGVSAIEINLTCPNVKEGGAQFSSDPDMIFRVVKAVRDATDLPLISKFSPVRHDVTLLAKTCEDAGADAVCPNFTAVGMAIDIETRRSRMGKNVMGGIGGPWKKPVALRMAWQTAQSVRIPVIGCGGITGPEDAIEFLIAGASAVEIGTYGLIHPGVTIETIRGIRNYLLENGINRVTDLIGTFVLA